MSALHTTTPLPTVPARCSTLLPKQRGAVYDLDDCTHFSKCWLDPSVLTSTQLRRGFPDKSPASHHHPPAPIFRAALHRASPDTNALVAHARCDRFGAMYVFTFDNLRSTHMADVRRRFVSGRTFLGKNKVAQVALGRSESEAYAAQTHLVSDHLLGQCGLLFTDEPEEDVIRSALTQLVTRPRTHASTHPKTTELYAMHTALSLKKASGAGDQHYKHMTEGSARILCTLATAFLQRCSTLRAVSMAVLQVV
jgi:hypothetical protein